MSSLLIIGAGGHGKVVAEAAESMRCWDGIVFLDDKYPDVKRVLNYTVIGTIKDANQFLTGYDSATVAIGNSEIRTNVLSALDKLGFLLPTIIHSTASVSPSASLGMGCVIFANAVINAEASLGLGCIVNTSAVVEHDCCLGRGVHISPSASLGGGVEVGDFSWVGIGSSIVHELKIGKRVTVGAGAAVVKSIVDELTVVGVPAKKVSK